MIDYIEPLKVNKLPLKEASRISEKYGSSTSREHKKEEGQFFTSVEMAQALCEFVSLEELKFSYRILDPGCGTLILTCALLNKLFELNPNIEDITIDAYETDTNLTHQLNEIIASIYEWAIDKRIRIQINLFNEDFLKSHLVVNRLQVEHYDYIISNPPYFKLNKLDDRLINFSKLSGQQNIYSLFLLASADLIKETGQLLYIIPRSFSSGSYFQSFRDIFFGKVRIDSIHMFNSRNDSFKPDKVLQENVFLKGFKREQINYAITVSISETVANFSDRRTNFYDINELYKTYSSVSLLHIPESVEQRETIQVFSEWENSLRTYGMKAHTGPVVPFRAKRFIRKRRNKNLNLSPLLWMNNCLRMETVWPLNLLDKGQYIIDNHFSSSKTIKNENYVLIRRFSSKDDKHKIISTPLLKEHYCSNYIGIENHLNYIKKVNEQMSKEEAVGLAAFFNAEIFEDFYRSLSGNTQVNTTDLNVIPMPALENIISIGRDILNPEINETPSEIVLNYI